MYPSFYSTFDFVFYLFIFRSYKWICFTFALRETEMEGSFLIFLINILILIFQKNILH